MSLRVPGIACRIRVPGPPDTWTARGCLSPTRPFVLGAALYLGLHRGRPVSRTALVALLWPDADRSRWRDVSRQLAGTGDDYDADLAMHLVDDAIERAWVVGRDELPTLRGILSPIQLHLAPWVPTIARREGQPQAGIRLVGF